MTPAVRVLHFARIPTTASPGPLGQETVARVFLDEHPEPVGSIVRQFQAWHYLLANGTSSGLVSTQSRPDLEQQVVSLYFGPEPVKKSTAPTLPLAM